MIRSSLHRSRVVLRSASTSARPALRPEISRSRAAPQSQSRSPRDAQSSVRREDTRSFDEIRRFINRRHKGARPSDSAQRVNDLQKRIEELSEASKVLHGRLFPSLPFQPLDPLASEDGMELHEKWAALQKQAHKSLRAGDTLKVFKAFSQYHSPSLVHIHMALNAWRRIEPLNDSPRAKLLTRRQVRLGVQQILSNQLLNASTAINSPFFMSDKTNAEVSVPEHAKQVPTAKTFQLVFLCVQKHAIWELGEFAIDVLLNHMRKAPRLEYFEALLDAYAQRAAERAEVASETSESNASTEDGAAQKSAQKSDIEPLEMISRVERSIVRVQQYFGLLAVTPRMRHSWLACLMSCNQFDRVVAEIEIMYDEQAQIASALVDQPLVVADAQVDQFEQHVSRLLQTNESETAPQLDELSKSEDEGEAAEEVESNETELNNDDKSFPKGMHVRGAKERLLALRSQQAIEERTWLMVLDRLVTQKIWQHKNLTHKNLAEKNLADKNLADKNLTESTASVAAAAQSCIELMEAHEVALTSNIFAVLLKAHCADRNLNGVLQSFQHMASLGLKPTRQCLETLLQCIAQQLDDSRAQSANVKSSEDNAIRGRELSAVALSLIKSAQTPADSATSQDSSPRAETPSALFQSFATSESDSPDDSSSMLAETLTNHQIAAQYKAIVAAVRGIGASEGLYRHALSIVCELGQPQLLLEIFEKMKQETIKPTQDMSAAILNALNVALSSALSSSPHANSTKTVSTTHTASADKILPVDQNRALVFKILRRLRQTHAVPWSLSRFSAAVSSLNQINSILSTVCPLCGGGNNCNVSSKTSSEPLNCWCTKVKTPVELQNTLPDCQACMCRQCVESFRVKGLHHSQPHPDWELLKVWPSNSSTLLLIKSMTQDTRYSIPELLSLYRNVHQLEPSHSRSVASSALVLKLLHQQISNTKNDRENNQLTHAWEKHIELLASQNRLEEAIVALEFLKANSKLTEKMLNSCFFGCKRTKNLKVAQRAWSVLTQMPKLNSNFARATLCELYCSASVQQSSTAPSTDVFAPALIVQSESSVAPVTLSHRIHHLHAAMQLIQHETLQSELFKMVHTTYDEIARQKQTTAAGLRRFASAEATPTEYSGSIDDKWSEIGKFVTTRRASATAL